MEAPPFTLVPARGREAPVLVDSPHSGLSLPADFVTSAPREALLTTWDAFVDELWGDAPSVGVTLVHAHFPRAYIDANRAADDIDPALLAGAWPGPLKPTAYSARGMGLIRRHALPGIPMYDAPLAVADVQHRLVACYTPYREVIRAECERLHTRHGAVWHLDMHSMKSTGNAMNVDAGSRRPDVVVSDRRGTSSDPGHTRWVADWFRSHGWSAQLNEPYQGGDLVAANGAPAQGRHSLQVELNRALYMDEAAFSRAASFESVRATCTQFLRDFADYAVERASAGASP